MDNDEYLDGRRKLWKHQLLSISEQPGDDLGQGERQSQAGYDYSLKR
jgi:hypothetical protein